MAGVAVCVRGGDVPQCVDCSGIFAAADHDYEDVQRGGGGVGLDAGGVGGGDADWRGGDGGVGRFQAADGDGGGGDVVERGRDDGGRFCANDDAGGGDGGDVSGREYEYGDQRIGVCGVAGDGSGGDAGADFYAVDEWFVGDCAVGIGCGRAVGRGVGGAGVVCGGRGADDAVGGDFVLHAVCDPV